jgi:hypothetical protein
LPEIESDEKIMAASASHLCSSGALEFFNRQVFGDTACRALDKCFAFGIDKDFFAIHSLLID